LPTGEVRSVGPLDKALAFPGVDRVETWIEVGETIRPVQTDGDRRGYVIARGSTNLEALERAEAAAGLIDVLTDVRRPDGARQGAEGSALPGPERE
jgi:hypothetical protein